MKIIDLHNEDLSYTPEAMDIRNKSEDFFKSLMEKFPDYNPREMAQIIYDACSRLSVRQILFLRRQL